MQRFEVSGETPLLQMLLEMIYKVYVDPSVTPQERHMLQPCFLIGLRARAIKTRTSFFAVLDAQLAARSGVADRLEYIVGKQEWETMAKTYWIRQALDMLLSVVKVGVVCAWCDCCFSIVVKRLLGRSMVNASMRVAAPARLIRHRCHSPNLIRWHSTTTTTMMMVM
jgi:hypothetical protein